MLIVFLDEMDGRDMTTMEETFAPFRKAGFSIQYAEKTQCDSEDKLISVLQHATVAYCIGNPNFTQRVMENCPDLRMIQRAGIGVNSIDLDAAARQGIVVCNCVGYCIEELAVHATGLILDNLRTISYYDRAVRKGQWPKGEGRQPRRASRLTVGLFGLGGSGRIMARIWHDGFGCRVIACDPYIPPEKVAELHVELVSFDTLCRESDILSVHAPLTKETYHTFDAQAFEKMKPNAIIANVTRGPLIDNNALADALKQHRIMAAGLDTFEQEPLDPDDPLLSLSDCTVLTPHSAFAAKEADDSWLLLSTVLPVRAMLHKTLYLPYLANRSDLSVFEAAGYTILRETIQ